MLHCSTLYYSISNYIALNLAILIKKVITWWCGGVVVVVVVRWFILPIIEPPQSRLFNSGLNWVVAIWGAFETESQFRGACYIRRDIP